MGRPITFKMQLDMLDLEKTSHKHAREVAVAIKGLSIEKARDYLLAVINQKEQLHLEDTKIKLT